MHYQKINSTNIVIASVLIGTYATIFWGLKRSDFILLYLGFSVAFLLHLYSFSKWSVGSQPYFYITIGLVIKLMAVFAFPTLSEDIYRYIWDGYLIMEGISPYALRPEECIHMFSIQDHPFLHSIYPFLNSPLYYSVYPPVAQSFFSFGGWLAKSSGIAAAAAGLKTLFLLVELAGWFFIYQLFQAHKTDPRWFWALWLNPLLIIEWNFSGHIESLAAAFIATSFFMLKWRKNYLSAVLLALAVLVKLWPIVFAPFFIKHLESYSSRLKWALTFSITGLLGAIPLFLQLNYFVHFKSSIDLYFKTFEFNASIYYLLRSIGTWWYGYNPIHIIGPVCTTMMAIVCIFLYQRKKVEGIPQLTDGILLCGIVYLLFATTVHPWYLSILLPFAYLNGRWSIIFWSYLIFASYVAYSFSPITENFPTLIFSYSMVFLAIWKDWKLKSSIY